MVELANLVVKNKLVDYSTWENYIDSLKTKELIVSEKKAVEVLSPLFLEAVKKRIPKKRFGIFFSGGVDSTTIAYVCKKFTDNFICYTVGIKGSQDLEMSERIAKKLKLNYVKKELTLKEMEALFERTAKIIGPYLNVVNLGVGAVELAVIDLAKKDKIDTFFGGLGSEEIFAGYHRHEESSDINAECWKGLKTTWHRDFNRDFRIAKATSSNFLTPFLDKDLIIEAMKVSGELKIKEGVKKYVFRKVAENLGLDKEFAKRPKKAAQYGSSFDKAILKIAKSKNFKFKKEYLEYLSTLQ